jgi:hypothetical protein
MKDEVRLGDNPTEQRDLEGLNTELLRLKEELLSARDTIVGHEARLGETLGEVRRLEAELVRYRERVEELDRIQRTPAWKVLQAVRRLRTLLAES